MILCMSNFAPRFLFHYGAGPHFSINLLRFNSSGSLAILAAIRRASSFVSSLAADRLARHRRAISSPRAK